MKRHRTHKRLDPRDGKFWPVETLCGPFYNWYDVENVLVQGNSFRGLQQAIWHVTPKTLLVPRVGLKRSDLRHHASFDVNEVDCPHCLRKLAEYALERLAPGVQP